jgi:hypothetical protein
MTENNVIKKLTLDQVDFPSVGKCSFYFIKMVQLAGGKGWIFTWSGLKVRCPSSLLHYVPIQRQVLNSYWIIFMCAS